MAHHMPVKTQSTPAMFADSRLETLVAPWSLACLCSLEGQAMKSSPPWAVSRPAESFRTSASHVSGGCGTPSLELPQCEPTVILGESQPLGGMRLSLFAPGRAPPH